MTREGDRWRKSDYAEGSAYSYIDGGLYDYARVSTSDERCQDDATSRHWGPLLVEKNFLTGAIANGVNWKGDRVNNWPVLGDSRNSFPDYPTLEDPISDGAAATLLASRTNPSRPSVDIPAFFGELHDLPSILKVEGKNILQKAASLNLNYRFGIKPLIGDLVNTLLFLAEAKKRFKELQDHRDTGFNITKEVHRTSGQRTFNVLWGASTVFSGYYTCTQICTQRTWGHIRWDSDWSSAQDNTSLSDVFLNGLNLNGSTTSNAAQSALLSTWELLPWSWFIDWFANVQQTILARRNTVGYHIGACHVMRHTDCLSDFQTQALPDGCSLDKAKHHRIVKARGEKFPSLDASLPVLNAGQWSILGSLAILRGR